MESLPWNQILCILSLFLGDVLLGILLSYQQGYLR